LILVTLENDPAYIVIDALDEVQDFDRSVLLHALSAIAEKSNNVVKIFTTSRTDSATLAMLSNVRLL